jgi:hypothetical protein
MNYEERVLRRVPLEVAVLAFVLAIVSLLFSSPLTGVFILAGGIFAALTFIWLKRALLRFISQDRRRAVRSGLALYLLRIVLILAVFSIIILVLPRMILAFVAGFSSLVLAILVEAVIAFSQMKQWKG